MGYDPARDVFVLFGGFDADHVLADTWEFDGERWQCVLGCEKVQRRFPIDGNRRQVLPLASSLVP